MNLDGSKMFFLKNLQGLSVIEVYFQFLDPQFLPGITVLRS